MNIYLEKEELKNLIQIIQCAECEIGGKLLLEADKLENKLLSILENEE